MGGQILGREVCCSLSWGSCLPSSQWGSCPCPTGPGPLACPVSPGKELPYKSAFQVAEVPSVRSTSFLELFGRERSPPPFPPYNSSWDPVSARAAHGEVDVVGFVRGHFGSVPTVPASLSLSFTICEMSLTPPEVTVLPMGSIHVVMGLSYSDTSWPETAAVSFHQDLSLGATLTSNCCS